MIEIQSPQEYKMLAEAEVFLAAAALYIEQNEIAESYMASEGANLEVAASLNQMLSATLNTNLPAITEKEEIKGEGLDTVKEVGAKIYEGIATALSTISKAAVRIITWIIDKLFRRGSESDQLAEQIKSKVDGHKATMDSMGLKPNDTLTKEQLDEIKTTEKTLLVNDKNMVIPVGDIETSLSKHTNVRDLTKFLAKAKQRVNLNETYLALTLDSENSVNTALSLTLKRLEVFVSKDCSQTLRGVKGDIDVIASGETSRGYKLFNDRMKEINAGFEETATARVKSELVLGPFAGEITFKAGFKVRTKTLDGENRMRTVNWSPAASPKKRKTRTNIKDMELGTAHLTRMQEERARLVDILSKLQGAIEVNSLTLSSITENKGEFLAQAVTAIKKNQNPGDTLLATEAIGVINKLGTILSSYTKIYTEVAKYAHTLDIAIHSWMAINGAAIDLLDLSEGNGK